MATVPKSVREAEAKALKALWDAQLPKPNQSHFAKANGLGTGSMVYQYTTNHRPLNLDIATKFARGLGVPIDKFSPRLAAQAMQARDVAHGHWAVRPPTAPLVARERLPELAWPFPRIDQARLLRLEKAQIRDLEAALLLAAAQLGVVIAKRRAA